MTFQIFCCLSSSTQVLKLCPLIIIDIAHHFFNLFNQKWHKYLQHHQLWGKKNKKLLGMTSWNCTECIVIILVRIYKISIFPSHCMILSYTSNLYWIPFSSCSSCGTPGNLLQKRALLHVPPDTPHIYSHGQSLHTLVKNMYTAKKKKK